jgi:hypothetical protein
VAGKSLTGRIDGRAAHTSAAYSTSANQGSITLDTSQEILTGNDNSGITMSKKLLRRVS